MNTVIAAFHQDDALDWVADLGCGHRQHMRHRPPWTERAWVTTAEGRAGKIGAAVDCSLCDAIALPENAVEYRRTATFTAETLPAALRADHSTKAGTWARIVVDEGEVDYHVRGRVHRLDRTHPGLVEPQIPHHVTPLGTVRLHVVFFRVS